MHEYLIRDPGTIPSTPYSGYIRTSMSHAMLMTLRHKRVVLAGVVTLAPVIIPVALAFLSTARYAENGYEVFVRMTEMLYLPAMAPLLALFFGSMLVGEDVESQTIPYLLTRPMPRSAWVLGRFLAYLVISSVILMSAILLTFFACTALGGVSLNRDSLELVGHYLALNFLGLMAYGALCMFMGAYFRHPVVLGVVALFGWQRIATIVPGLVDFLTIEKYLTILLPKVAIQRENQMIKTALVEFQKKEFLISGTRALVTLVVITVVLLAVTSYVVRQREYSSARAVGS